MKQSAYFLKIVELDNNQLKGDIPEILGQILSRLRGTGLLYQG
jgi:hypothetical protein